MDDGWYYTLSTIAQTLAAILGLAVVFATIRLQNIVEELKGYKRIAHYIAEKIHEHISINYDKRIAGITASGLCDVLNKIEKHYPAQYKGNSGIESGLTDLAQTFYPNLRLDNLKFIEDTTYHLGFYIKQRNNLMKTIKWPGIISAGTIIYTILLLSISKLLYCDKVFATQLFTLAVFLSTLSILLIINASWNLFKNSAEKM